MSSQERVVLVGEEDKPETEENGGNTVPVGKDRDLEEDGNQVPEAVGKVWAVAEVLKLFMRIEEFQDSVLK